MAARRPGLAIFGGTFNPPHIGHFRLVVEVREALGELVDGVDLVPCARPPHKGGGDLLPFDLRCSLLEACMAPLPWLRCNRLEAERDEPSYTVITLETYRERIPGANLYFLMGSPDYAALPHWRRGLELPALCNFVVVPRGDMVSSDFVELTLSLWPDAEEQSESALPGGRCMALPGGGLAHYLPLPWLPISASFVRERWLAGRSINYLVPEAALALLEKQRPSVTEIWKRRGRP